jgi:hypothetical protein
MTYEEFLEHVPQKCMYETIYSDSEGRTILVVGMLDAYAMVNRLVKAEREACAKLIDDFGTTLANGEMLAEAIRARGQA